MSLWWQDIVHLNGSSRQLPFRSLVPVSVKQIVKFRDNNSKGRAEILESNYISKYSKITG